MSETVKLVIEITKASLDLLNTTGVDWLGAEHILSAVAKGTPLDDVKAEIVEEIEDVGNGAYSDGLYKALEILANIVKGDEE